MVIDSRGHGRSTPLKKGESLHYADLADDIQDFIKALALERPILCGFSDGGIVGLLIAMGQEGRASNKGNLSNH